MSLFTKFQAAIQSENVQEYGALYHEDFQFIRHQTGNGMNKTEGRFHDREDVRNRSCQTREPSLHL